MKRLILSLTVSIVIFSLLGCTTTKVAGSGIKGKSASVKTGKRVIVDYQGPHWEKKSQNG